jgi:uncharacterized protein (TIGR02996 family)
MTTEDALIKGALEAPENSTARLVLADWLDEHQHSEQAEVIRIRCSLEQPSHKPENRMAWHQRESELCEKRAEDWVEQCGLPLNWTQALAVFRQRLAETMTCCGGDDRLLWRPFLSSPNIIREPLHDSFIYRTTKERQDIVTRLASQRVCLLTERVWPDDVKLEEVTGGRLLVFYPDATLSDGVAYGQSGAFFNEENIPPWDTWVMATEVSRHEPGTFSYNSYLVCWVPPKLIEHADHWINLHPLHCIRWASDVDTALTRKLRDAGLLT